MLGSLLRRDQRGSFPTMSQLDYYQQYAEFAFAGVQYVIPSGQAAEMTALQGEANPIVAAAISIRQAVFSEIRFAFQTFDAGRPGRLFGTKALSVLEQPWPGATTRDLLAAMEVDASLYGNSYWTVYNRELVRMDPTKVIVLRGSAFDEVTGREFAPTLLGYAVVNDNEEVAVFGPDQIVHYAPLKTGTATFMGRSWLGSVLPDVGVDRALTQFKQSFVTNGAIPGLVVTYPPGVSEEQVKQVKDAIERRHAGTTKAFRTLHLGGGADPKVIGANFADMDVKNVQGSLETRISVASGVPATVLGISEGLQGSQLNAGNYVASRRRFADGTVRPLWRAVCSALEVIARPPDGLTRLWYEDRDVPFLQEDVKDAAEIKAQDAAALRQLVDGGFTPESAVAAVVSGDYTQLEHSGKLSVQLQPPGTGETDD